MDNRQELYTICFDPLFLLAGLYYCHASNSLGESSCKLELTGELHNLLILSSFFVFILFMTSQGEEGDRPGAG